MVNSAHPSLLLIVDVMAPAVSRFCCHDFPPGWTGPSSSANINQSFSELLLSNEFSQQLEKHLACCTTQIYTSVSREGGWVDVSYPRVFVRDSVVFRRNSTLIELPSSSVWLYRAEKWLSCTSESLPVFANSFSLTPKFSQQQHSWSDSFGWDSALQRAWHGPWSGFRECSVCTWRCSSWILIALILLWLTYKFQFSPKLNTTQEECLPVTFPLRKSGRQTSMRTEVAYGVGELHMPTMVHRRHYSFVKRIAGKSGKWGDALILFL